MCFFFFNANVCARIGCFKSRNQPVSITRPLDSKTRCGVGSKENFHFILEAFLDPRHSTFSVVSTSPQRRFRYADGRRILLEEGEFPNYSQIIYELLRTSNCTNIRTCIPFVNASFFLGIDRFHFSVL